MVVGGLACDGIGGERWPTDREDSEYSSIAIAREVRMESLFKTFISLAKQRPQNINRPCEPH